MSHLYKTCPAHTATLLIPWSKYRHSFTSRASGSGCTCHVPRRLDVTMPPFSKPQATGWYGMTLVADVGTAIQGQQCKGFLSFDTTSGTAGRLVWNRLAAATSWRCNIQWISTGACRHIATQSAGQQTNLCLHASNSCSQVRAAAGQHANML